MKNKIATLILGILLIGIASAGLVDYLSNTITGEIEVKGPVFYASSGHNLLINSFLGEYTYTINDANNQIFLSANLDEPLDFYQPELTLYVKANLTQGIEPKNLDLELWYIDNEDNLKHICSGPVQVEVSSEDDWQELSASCVGTSELKDVKKFKYVISGLGGDGSGTEYKIKIDGYTRVEMDKA